MFTLSFSDPNKSSNLVRKPRKYCDCALKNQGQAQDFNPQFKANGEKAAPFQK